jgi:hypothetical protein
LGKKYFRWPPDGGGPTGQSTEGHALLQFNVVLENFSQAS